MERYEIAVAPVLLLDDGTPPPMPIWEARAFTDRFSTHMGTRHGAAGCGLFGLIGLAKVGKLGAAS